MGSGLKNSETIGSVTLSTNATLSSSGNYIVGNWTITPSNATGGTFTASNYNITYTPVSGSLTINAKAINVTGITANNKAYDGTTNATLNLAGAALSGVIGSDAVTLNTSGATGTFASQNVGNNVTVTISGLTTSGLDTGNYSLAQPTTTANITPAIPPQPKANTPQINNSLFFFNPMMPETPIETQLSGIALVVGPGVVVAVPVPIAAVHAVPAAAHAIMPALTPQPALTPVISQIRENFAAAIPSASMPRIATPADFAGIRISTEMPKPAVFNAATLNSNIPRIVSPDAFSGTTFIAMMPKPALFSGAVIAVAMPPIVTPASFIGIGLSSQVAAPAEPLNKRLEGSISGSENYDISKWMKLFDNQSGNMPRYGVNPTSTESPLIQPSGRAGAGNKIKLRLLDSESK